MRSSLSALLLAAVLAVPSAAFADIIGASAKYHGGFQKTADTSTWVTGAEFALQMLGFEFFADVRLFENHIFFEDSQPKSDWYWDRIGARFNLGLPFTFGADNADLFIDAAYISSLKPIEQRNREDEVLEVGDAPVFEFSGGDDKGFAVGAGLRFDYGLFGPFYFTIQPEIGVDLLLFGPKEVEPGIHLSMLAAIKIDI